jgi:hypothetical protein
VNFRAHTPRSPRRRTRGVGALAAALLLTGLAAPVATAASPSAPPKLPAGLYGAADPTYDGVFRQATALLALSTTHESIPAAAVSWLAHQQCADGGFQAYRADTAKPCTAKSEDTNSTGMAIEALAALGGQDGVVSKAAGWLRGVQNADGGWGYQPGYASDADSTGLVVGALTAAKADPGAAAKGGHTPLDALEKLRLGCSAKAAQRGAFAYQPGKHGALAPNEKATTDGVLGAASAGYLVSAPQRDLPVKARSCPAAAGADSAQSVAQAGAAYLAADLAGHGDHAVSLQPGAAKPAPDPGTTAYAVIALAATSHPAEARKAYAWLESNGTGWAKSSPAGLGALILAAHAVGADPTAFGHADLVGALTALGPKSAAATASSAGSSASASSASSAKKGGGSLAVWWLVGVGLLVGIGIGGVLSLRAKKGAIKP